MRGNMPSHIHPTHLLIIPFKKQKNIKKKQENTKKANARKQKIILFEYFVIENVINYIPRINITDIVYYFRYKCGKLLRVMRVQVIM